MIDNYLGQTIGNYIMLEKLGSGGFGSVYRAQNKLITERVVAIKVISEQYVSSPEECKNFLNEARVLLKLQHPYILPIFDIGEYQGRPYMVIELAPTGSLSNYINQQQQKPLPVDKALTILTQVGQGLHFAHQQRIVHRDLKPDNILFNAKGDAMLADFGISIEVATSTLGNLAVTGTPPYMAPEQFQGTTSMLSDQYALGCIAYELLTGRRPFQASTFTEWAIQHTRQKPIPPRQLNPAIPQHIEQAILKALTKDRTQRYTDIAAFVAALSPQKALPTVPTRKILRSPAGQTVLDKSEVTIGRGQDNTYAIADAQISNHHAVIRLQGENYAIFDLGSTNKTYVNGQAIPPHTAHILQAGDKIRIGQTSFEFTNEISTPSAVAALRPTIAAPPPPTVAAPAPSARVATPLPASRVQQAPHTPRQYRPPPVPLGPPQTTPPPPAPGQKHTALWIVLGVVGGLIGLFVIIGIIASLARPDNTAKKLDLNRTYIGHADKGADLSLIFTRENESTGVIGGQMTVSTLTGQCTFNNGTVNSQGHIKFSCPITTRGETFTLTFTGVVSSDNSSIDGQYTGTDGESGTWRAQES